MAITVLGLSLITVSPTFWKNCIPLNIAFNHNQNKSS
jgi:hypothetical protein